MSFRKLAGGRMVERGADVISRLGVPPVAGYDYPRCHLCGTLRSREVTARACGELDVASKLRGEQTSHIGKEHPWTLGDL